MNWKLFLGGMGLFLLGQTLAWYQTNGQFLSTWVKEHPILIAAIGGIPVGYSYILGTTYLVQALIHLNETVTLKTGIILMLAVIIVLLQVLWK